MKRLKLSRKQLILLIVCAAMLLAAAVCFGIRAWLSGLLTSQQEAERWQGESETAFSQISCFLPADKQITLSQVNTFRNDALKKLEGASLNVKGDERLMLDAWSTSATVKAETDIGRGDAAVIAVGGDFFEFHPLRLLNGDYIRQSDLMQDRVLLDEDLAWLLFGGTELQGMPLKLNGVPFTVAGVVEREQDFASRKAYTAGLGLFMRYDALLQLNENAKISCYECVLAEPVKGFALGVAQEKFPIGGGEILCNTTRYEYGRLMNILLKYGSRSTQTTGVVFPYWENAARTTEDWGSLCCVLGTVLPIFPLIIALVVLIPAIRRGKTRLEEDIFPDVKDRTEEAIRVRQRRRWERRHGLHEKR